MNDGSVSRERSESATKIQNSVHGFRNDKTIKVFACPSLLQFFLILAVSTLEDGQIVWTNKKSSMKT